jgi:valyl-tRNA synthetase
MNRGRPPKPGQLSDAERAARLAEMQANADVHEEQRWQRLKRAADADAKEVKRSDKDKSNEEFLADTQKSIFGSERASASTIEKSVKRRAHFIERSNADNERNAFRR